MISTTRSRPLTVVDAVHDSMIAYTDSEEIRHPQLDRASRARLLAEVDDGAVHSSQQRVGKGFEFFSRGGLDDDPIGHKRPDAFRWARTRS